jgi:Tfp pilus assembly protein PilF
VIDYSVATKNQSNSILKPALDRFQSNDLAGAIESLETVAESQRNADYQILYASLLLTVGQVEQASQHLDQAQQTSTQNANVVALRSIIALAKSDRQTALKLAQQAQQISPKTAAPNIALSYAYQALFDIDKALDSAIQAAQAAPDNGLAWARVSEMQLATSNVDESMQAASKAQTLNPKLAKTNTELGFARLASLDLSDAEQSFRTAIQRDPSDPLARLGLGLAKIRQGHIKSGTKDMETAANLDPDNALIRSYLGKAYYEQRRGDIASTEYAIAKELDPNDPTPWFYDAILKQTTNRPVEALHNMQKAIELNDNRAVYRSRFLLDDDIAARSASLGRIYNDLGFQDRGLFEGWKSVNTNPENYSAHRLLADNYAALPRHEIARVSELLQSQLLQPINVTPIQPQLAESNLLLLDGQGPQSSSFNEFNPLFKRNRLALQASGIYGSQNTWGEEVTQSGLWENFSYSLGQFHYKTDGFRENNDINQDIYNVFTQISVSPNFNLQAEYRNRDVKHGDVNYTADGSFDLNVRNESRSDTWRIGAHYAPAQHSDFIVSAIYQDAKTLESKLIDTGSPGVGPRIHINESQRGYITEAQYLFKASSFKFIGGGGYYDIDKFSTIDGNSNAQHVNGYGYSYISFPTEMIWTLGLSYDHLKDPSIGSFSSLDALNWKVGLNWNLTKNTTLRLASFKVIKRSLINDQTIEPTQVAGFNQFFSFFDATESKRYAIALDQKFSTRFFGGVEFSLQDLKIPVQGFSDSQGNKIEFLEHSELTTRTYLNWAPLDSLAFSFNYQYENFHNRTDAFGDAPHTKTHSGTIAFNYFHPSNLFAKVTSSYVNQAVNFKPLTGRDEMAHEDFFIVNLAIGYRLPSRYGIISLQALNLLDKKFRYQGLQFRTNNKIDDLQAAPAPMGRSVFFRASLSF